MKHGTDSPKDTPILLIVIAALLTPSNGCRRPYPPQPIPPVTNRVVTPVPAQVQEVIDFNRDWRFAKGKPINEEDVSFDKAVWETVHLPHDWALSGPSDVNESGSAGTLPTTVRYDSPWWCPPPTGIATECSAPYWPRSAPRIFPVTSLSW